jgi:hypothetical protein
MTVFTRARRSAVLCFGPVLILCFLLHLKPHVVFSFPADFPALILQCFDHFHNFNSNLLSSLSYLAYFLFIDPYLFTYVLSLLSWYKRRILVTNRLPWSSPSSVPVLSKMTAVLVLAPRFVKISFNIMLLLLLYFPNGFSLSLFNQTFVGISHVHCECCVLHPTHLHWMIIHIQQNVINAVKCIGNKFSCLHDVYCMYPETDMSSSFHFIDIYWLWSRFCYVVTRKVLDACSQLHFPIS